MCKRNDKANGGDENREKNRVGPPAQFVSIVSIFLHKLKMAPQNFQRSINDTAAYSLMGPDQILINLSLSLSRSYYQD